MAKQILDADKVYDLLDEHALEITGIQGLIGVLEDIVLENSSSNCGLSLCDPAHPVQQMHAIIVAIRRQVKHSERLVQTIILEPVGP